ncbi:MAG: alpha-amylase [Spirochaetaceae bacterium]|jgi:glycosidase|nr:alpha-amylase [Spirochaetaceae bacterium]
MKNDCDVSGTRVFLVRLAAFEPEAGGARTAGCPRFEFHICGRVRAEHGLDKDLFTLTGNVILADIKAARSLAAKLNSGHERRKHPEKAVSAGKLNAMGLIDEILHYLVGLYRQQVRGGLFEDALSRLESALGADKTSFLLETFCTEFPPKAVYVGECGADLYLSGGEGGLSHRAMALEELLLLAIANLNPAFSPFLFLFDDAPLEAKTVYSKAVDELRAYLAECPAFGPDGQNLWDLLRAPALASPDSLEGQLKWMRERWGLILHDFLSRLLTGLDVISEEDKPRWDGTPGPTEAYSYGYLQNEYENFSTDLDWMPRTVLIAKSTLVWLWQLSRKYGQEIRRLDDIPDEELDELARRGFTGLWLIGLWERSHASRTIKQWKGNPEAAASAYSLYDYDIAWELGGWGALCGLRDRCIRRGIRLGSDMVPNHTGIDSKWIIEHPDRFLQLASPPYPQYKYESGNLSNNPDIVVQIEDHYYDNSDCAVVFHHYDRRTNRHRYIYHGNDGTSMPWNDTAQIDFLNPEAREAVISTIIGVCRQFSIVRFDAAMTLAKRHIQRLWYPEPGRGGDIASRAEHAISMEEFNRRIPNEFWREVVDRCASEAPNTLLLAEAFWMMEGYFVRTLGMHRVYNSAFMNMLKKEENQKYRDTIKNTLSFDPEILKRFVNFMNNPDEETAAAQFGKGDKYFGICTLMVTMPGLPMFGHGQIEGYEEKYGMEYRRAYRDEAPDSGLIDRHEREIFPLMKRRMLFSGSANFCLFDLWLDGQVNENVFAYTNRADAERALVLYNNSYYEAAGWINSGCVDIPQKDGGSRRQDGLAEALLLHNDSHYFALLREMRRGLWFIRSSKELFEKGLFVHLAGYETQVYLDIHEVEDGDFSTWARLHAELNGAGMKDPKEALEDMLLGEIFGPFCELFRLEQIEDARKVFSGESSGPGAETLKAVEKFLEAGKEFRKEAAYDPFAGGKQGGTLDVEAAVKSWEKTLTAYAASFKAAASHAGKDNFAASLADRLVNELQLGAFVYGYTVFGLCASIVGKNANGAEAVTLFEFWHFDRKMRECFEDLGIDGAAAYRFIEIAKALTRRLVPGKTGVTAEWVKTGPLTALSIVRNTHDSEDFRRLLGVNEWGGVDWFNKEAFEEALFYTAAIAAAYADIDAVSALVAELSRAELKSGYKLPELIKALGGKSSVKKAAPGTKAAPAKAAASKTAGGKATPKKAAAPKTSSPKKPSAKKKD